MSIADTLLALVALWAIAVVTPGPNTILVAGLALSSPRVSSVAAVCGILLGTTIWGLAGLFGLFWLIEVVPTIASALKLIGGGYLCWVGLRLAWRNVRQAPSHAPLSPRSDALPPPRAFGAGLATCLGNPKSLMFLGSLFAVSHLAEQPIVVGLGGLAIMLAMSATYYLLFALVLRHLGARGGQGRWGRVLGAAVGLAMVAFGARLAWER